MAKFRAGNWVYTYDEQGLVYKNQVLGNVGFLYLLTGRHEPVKTECVFKTKKECLQAMKKEGIQKASLHKATIIQLETKIADLEAKLEQLQKEKELDNSFWKQECDSLQKALAEKERQVNVYVCEIAFLDNKLAEKYKEIENLTTKLEEANHERHEEWKTGKEWKWEWQKTNRLLEEANQAKTDFAIEQLEKVKEFIEKDKDWQVFSVVGLIKIYIDQQINKLKEGK